MINVVLDGRFRIEETLSKSPNGEVYKGRDLANNEMVAIKVLRPRIFVGENFGARLRQEFRLLSQFQHPNVVRVIQSGSTPDQMHYFAMEYVNGPTLARVVAETGPMDPRRVADYLDQITAALDVAHSHGVVHRDINPSNVIIHRDAAGHETAKLLDFGLAKVLDADDTDGAMRATGPGVIMGRAAYMSPEQATGRPVSELADIYMLGVTTYELLTGKVPFEASNDVDLMIAQARDPAPSFRDRNPNVVVSSAIEDVVRVAMAKKPSERHRSAGDYARAFRAAVEHRQRRLSHRQRLAIFGASPIVWLVMAALAFAAIVYIMTHPSR